MPGFEGYTAATTLSDDDLLLVLDDPAGAKTTRNITALNVRKSLTFYANVKDYGAKGNAKTVSDGVIAGGALSTLTSATAGFVASDIGKVIFVDGAGAAAAQLKTTIAAVPNSTTVTLTAPATTAVTAARVGYGTNDMAAIQAAIDSGFSNVLLPATCLIDGSGLVVPAGKTLTGLGPASGLLCSAATTNPVNLSGLNDITVSNFKIDGGQVPVHCFTATAYATTLQTRLAIDRMWITNCTDNWGRCSSPQNDFQLTSNRVYNCYAGFSFQGQVAQKRIEITRNNVTNLAAASACVQVYGPVPGRFSDVQFSFNFFDPGTANSGAMPLECMGADNVVISNNVCSNGNNGISCAQNSNVVISNNVIRNQTAYAVEMNDDTHNFEVIGNLAINCASLVTNTGDATASSDVSIVNNTHIGSGAAASTGSPAITMRKVNGLRITGNVFRNLDYMQGAIQAGLGVGHACNDVVIEDNEMFVGTANADINFCAIGPGNDFTIRGNVIKITRNLAAGDDYKRIIKAIMGAVGSGGCDGVQIDNNKIIFTGTVASAANAVAIGTDFAGADVLPRAVITGNRVFNGPVAFRWDGSSADTIIEGNDGRTCATEWSNINGAVILRRTKREFEATAAPTTGTWAVGDLVYNATPAASGFVGWACVTAGTPGTWKTFGAISA